MKVLNLTKSNFITRFFTDFETSCSFIILAIGCIISYIKFSHEPLLYILIFIPVFIGGYLILFLNHKIYVFSIDFQSEIYYIIYYDIFIKKRIQTRKLIFLRDLKGVDSSGRIKIVTDDKILLQGRTGDWNQNLVDDLCKNFKNKQTSI